MMRILKLINIKLLLMTVMVIIMFVSCQAGFEETQEPDKSIAISANDNIADFILKMVLKDGSFDNIIDKCSEISIEYPYSVRINGEVINIGSLEDLESIKLNYFTYRDDIEIDYPITVSYSDYSESVLFNLGQLKKIQNRFNVNLIDDDIEGIDLVYPIEINMYNKQYQKTDLIVARNDYDMHRVFSNMKDLIVELNFPIEVELLNKDRITIGDNIKLENEIENVIDSGDEDDEVVFGDEDYPHKDLITMKDWKVLQYIDSKNETSSFRSYVFEFHKDKTVRVNTAKATVNGVWEINIHDNLKTLKIEFDTDETPLAWLNNDWEIKNTSPITINMEAESNIHGNNKKFILEAVDH